MSMFGKRNQAPIGRSLGGTGPVRYKLGGNGGKRAPASLIQMLGDELLTASATAETLTEAPPRSDRPPSFSVPPPADTMELLQRLAKKISLRDGDLHSAQSNVPASAAKIKHKVLPRLLDRIDAEAASSLSKAELAEEIQPILSEVLVEMRITLNRREQGALEGLLLDELLGLGPLEELIADDSVSDIMVNGPHQVYVEKAGKLIATDIHFQDDEHVLHIAQRICNRVGRRIDQTMPLCDARLPDGSRVNIVIPPLALKGPTISIRKFAKQPLSIDWMVKHGTMSTDMAVFLKIAAASRLNIVVSGGTGAGKTALLNALSQLISPQERIVTIEDAAELQLQQPHVVPLETRTHNLEGNGAVTMRDLLVNALRMRPDRIILGEVRGPEAFEMLQAMNTGHDGSLCTLHASRAREALTRLENMVSMAGFNYPLRAIRQQVADAVDVIVQISRMRDGTRRVTSIMEVGHLEQEVIQTQELFGFEYQGESADQKIHGRFVKSGLPPICAEKVRQFGFGRELMEAVT